jgi:hypothetical protein
MMIPANLLAGQENFASTNAKRQLRLTAQLPQAPDEVG